MKTLFRTNLALKKKLAILNERQTENKKARLDTDIAKEFDFLFLTAILTQIAFRKIHEVQLHLEIRITLTTLRPCSY